MLSGKRLISFGLLCLLLLGIMLRAGFWQLDRAAEKIARQQQFATAQTQAVAPLPANLIDPTSWQYRQVTVTGRLQNQHQFLLDNRVYEKQVGYDVLTPLQTDNGQWLLISRGWLPNQNDRSKLPDISVSTDLQTFKGYILLPDSGFRLGTIDADQQWPRVIQYIDYAELSTRLEQPLMPLLLVLAADQPASYTAYRSEKIPGPAKHYSYAVQWFTMALLVIIGFLILVVKRKAP